jgi:hypothetical protein
MPKKLTIEYVREQFEKEGYELLSKKYINAHTKLRYRCPNGHEHNITWASWAQGARCPYCYGNVKKTIEFIRSEFEKEDYILLTTEYKNCSQKLDYICPSGHKHIIKWNDWQQGVRCFHCFKDTRPSIKFIRSEFEKENYILLSNEYINAKQKLKYVCPKGHKGTIIWNNWQQGERCYYCAINITADKNRLTVEFVRSKFAKEGYRLLITKYEGAFQKLDYICPKGHKHSIKWSDWQQGHRCPYCFGKISRGEIEVRNFVESLGIKVLPNDRNQIFNSDTGYGFELDVFMPTLDKAIEYNGEYWHQDETRDLLKQQLCKEKDINLLTIWDKEWRTNSEKCKSKIMGFVFN